MFTKMVYTILVVFTEQAGVMRVKAGFNASVIKISELAKTQSPFSPELS